MNRSHVTANTERVLLCFIFQEHNNALNMSGWWQLFMNNNWPQFGDLYQSSDAIQESGVTQCIVPENFPPYLS